MLGRPAAKSFRPNVQQGPQYTSSLALSCISPDVFGKKGVLKNASTFTGKHLWLGVFFLACNFIAKETPTQMNFLRKRFLQNTYGGMQEKVKPEVYRVPCQTSRVMLFAKTVNSFQIGYLIRPCYTINLANTNLTSM